MDQSNRDVFPSEQTIALFPSIKVLITNAAIQDAFTARENAARAAKRRYHGVGRIALFGVVLGALYTIAEALVLHAPPHSLSIAMATVVGTGLALQIGLLVTRQKTQWLNNRFAAERVRSIKFQAYGLAAAAADAAALEAAVGQFYAEELALLDNEMNASEAVLKEFSPRRALARLPKPAKAANPALAVAAAKAYAELRTRYQSRFAADEAERLQNTLRLDYTFADILYMLGAAFTVAALVCKVALPSAHLLNNWIDFLAVSTFIVGLGKTMMDNASLSEESRMHYLNYADALDAAESQRTSLSDTIAAVEHAALEELRHFCQSATLISYRL